jgi:hypothetical protein
MRLQFAPQKKHHSTELAMQNAAVINNAESALWKRLLEPANAALSSDVAQYLLALSFPASDLDRMQNLAEKARSGALTLDEHVELDNYERVGHVLSLIKSQARQSLKKKPAVKRAVR